MYTKRGGVAAYHIVWIDFCLRSVPGVCVLPSAVDYGIIQGAAERSPLFGKLINSKPKKIRQMLFISGKYTECRFTSTCFEQNITQVAALNIDTLM